MEQPFFASCQTNKQCPHDFKATFSGFFLKRILKFHRRACSVDVASSITTQCSPGKNGGLGKNSNKVKDILPRKTVTERECHPSHSRHSVGLQQAKHNTWGFQFFVVSLLPFADFFVLFCFVFHNRTEQNSKTQDNNSPQNKASGPLMYHCTEANTAPPPPGYPWPLYGCPKSIPNTNQ